MKISLLLLASLLLPNFGEENDEEGEDGSCGCGTPTSREGVLDGATGSCDASKERRRSELTEDTEGGEGENTELRKKWPKLFEGKAQGCGTTVLPAGGVTLGSCDMDYIYAEDGECPTRKARVRGFEMDVCEITNGQFYLWWKDHFQGKTDAEKFGWSFVFELLVPKELNEQIDSAVLGAEWWIPVEGADFLHPYTPDVHISELDMWDHPASHISWNDAVAFCESRGMRLPTEAEWEHAARGGTTTLWWWGDELYPNLTADGTYSMNVFTGDPYKKDDLADGFPATAPVASYSPNPFGLFDVTGNVWEWVQDRFSHRPRVPKKGRVLNNPKGPKKGPERVMKGGSYMCHMKTCRRFRVAGRHHSTPDSSTGNMGFRCVKDMDDSKS